MDLTQALDIFYSFYPDKQDPLRGDLFLHSCQVQQKALEIFKLLPEEEKKHIDISVVENGALLHDVGVKMCHAPDIRCHGKEHYMLHGLLGAEMLREYGKKHSLDLEVYALICERHTGSGLTAAEIEEQALPLPPVDLLPETKEEKLICLADKFFSKSGSMSEKSMEKVYKSMAKHGDGPLQRFIGLCRLFHIETL